MAAPVENPFANPFPGMNPYLESRRLWPEVHNNIIHEMFRFSPPHSAVPIHRHHG